MRKKRQRKNCVKKRLARIRCSECGSKTKVVNAGKVFKRNIPGSIREILVCERYPLCDSYVSINTRDGRFGLPVNRKIRRLRRKAH